MRPSRDDCLRAKATGTTGGAPSRAHTYAIPVHRGGSADRGLLMLRAQRETQATARRRTQRTP